MLKELKKNSAKAQQLKSNYNYYKGTNKGECIFEIYKRPSERKAKALNYCLKVKNERKGFNACFCGHNCDVFSYAFTFIENGKEYLYYLTHLNEYIIEL